MQRVFDYFRLLGDVGFVKLRDYLQYHPEFLGGLKPPLTVPNIELDGYKLLDHADERIYALDILRNNPYIRKAFFQSYTVNAFFYNVQIALCEEEIDKAKRPRHSVWEDPLAAAARKYLML